MSTISDDEIEEKLEDLVGWARQGDLIIKTYKLPSFPAAIAFVVNVGFLAESAGHHPDIDIRYNKVTLALTTHDAGGISEKDFDLAAAADELMG
ncbi:4a-hydroxytetrahydrobiopterin dehydratase [Chloroflexales bacterium ZM16-3]|nr:4a-hydroxytetrahydrobiopterin dehydratase [Chloroflexales bacterium ZM16-3]